MSDPRPDGPPDTADPDGTPVDDPSGAAGDVDPVSGLALNPDLPLIDPSGG